VELLNKCWTIVRRRWPILLACLTVAVVALTVHEATANDKYAASTEVFLRAPDVKTSSSAYQGDLFSRQRAQTYVKMFRSDELAQMVIDKLSLTETAQQLVSQVSATTVKDTVLIVISVTDTNAQRAANIANTYGDVLGAYVAKLENVGNDPSMPPLVQVVTKANPNSAKFSGSPISMLTFAAVAMALLVATGVIWFLEHFDTRVRSRRQIEETTGSDIIGKLPKVPHLNSTGDVTKVFDESERFREASLRLSLNVESVLRRLPKVEIPPVVAVVAGHRGDEGTIATRALAQAFAHRGRMVGVVRFAGRRQQSVPTGQVAAHSALTDEDNRTDPVKTVTCSTAGLTAAIVGREVDALRPSSDVILIDTPTFHESIDAQLALGAADAAILVVRPIATTTLSLSELVVGIKVLGRPVLGVVANLAQESSTVEGFYL
jgi:capsular polysaccharide biosynthesis protein